MFKIVQNKIVPNVDINMDEVYNNDCIIIKHNHCNYISILDDKNNIRCSYITTSTFTISPSKMSNLIYTNDYSLWGYYIRSQKVKQFTNLDDYKEWLMQKSNSLKIINVEQLQIFKNLKLQSNSQLINYEKIYNWWFEVKRDVKFYPKKQLQIYNFFNFTLYLLSRNQFNVDDQNVCHKLKIDLLDSRTSNNSSLINFLTIKNNNDLWGKIKPNNGNFFFKIDYSSSFIQILSVILQCPIDYDDKYYYFYQKLKIQGQYDRKSVKGQVFNILFSNKIKKHLDIQFFQKAYNFSIYLQEEYVLHGYIESLLSEKKMVLDSQNGNMRKSLLLNKFIMNLETQIYIGVLYNLLNIDIKKIKPIIFIHDSFIFEIDNKVEDQKIKQINQVLQFSGLLNVTQYVGRSLDKLKKIC